MTPLTLLRAMSLLPLILSTNYLKSRPLRSRSGVPPALPTRASRKELLGVPLCLKTFPRGTRIGETARQFPCIRLNTAVETLVVRIPLSKIVLPTMVGATLLGNLQTRLGRRTLRGTLSPSVSSI